MPPSDLAPLIMGVTVTLAVAGVLILRPLAKRLANILELRAQEHHQRSEVSADDVAKIADALGRLTDRIEALEERQDFAERLLDSNQPGVRARLAEPRDS